jgi:hypothetical protein
LFTIDRNKKAKYYELLVILDIHTKDIWLTSSAQNKIYLLNETLKVLHNLMALEIKTINQNYAREYIKALAPRIKDDQIEYNSEINPLRVSGAHKPFPPFYCKCRTTTIILT